jgi:hypothetical protein
MWTYAAVVVLLLVGTPLASFSQTYSVTVAPGASPNLTPAEVAQKSLEAQSQAIDAISVDSVTGTIRSSPALPKVLSMACVPEQDLKTVEPRLGGRPDVDRLVWFVRVEGSFVGTAPAGISPAVAKRGYYLISDSDEAGVILQWGFFSEDVVRPATKQVQTDGSGAVPPRILRSDEVKWGRHPE